MDQKSQMLVLNCSSGISGDMTVAALLDLGADEEKLRHALASLPLEGARVQIGRVLKSGLDACDFNVILDAEHENHDHDMAYLHPDRVIAQECSHTHEHEHAHSHEHTDAHEHEHAHSHEHTNVHEHAHSHEHTDEHAHEHEHAHSHGHEHGHGHPHHGRNLADITAILRAGDLTPRALQLALRIFEIVAEAEAKVHGKSIQEVHFHEVGAVDSILDIAAAAICVDDLGITECVVTDLTEGTGTVRCQHGLLPIPVPATSEILRRCNLPLHIAAHVQGELVTPTGAAIAAALCTRDQLPERFRILKTGLGAGKRDYPVTGVVRAMLIEEEKDLREDLEDSVWKLESNVDDSTGEALAFTLEELLAAGALDAWFTPIFMKKNRPASLLSVLCREKDRACLEEILFRNTTTIGIRRMRCERTKLKRENRSIETPWGKARVKVCIGPEGERIYPEADSVAELARAHGIGFSQMYQSIAQYGKTREH